MFRYSRTIGFSEETYAQISELAKFNGVSRRCVVDCYFEIAKKALMKSEEDAKWLSDQYSKYNWNPKQSESMKSSYMRKNKNRDTEICEMFTLGKEIVKIAKYFDCSINTIRRVLIANGLKPVAKRGRPKAVNALDSKRTEERIKIIESMFAENKNLQDIAVVLNVTRQRVQQIVAQFQIENTGLQQRRQKALRRLELRKEERLLRAQEKEKIRKKLSALIRKGYSVAAAALKLNISATIATTLVKKMQLKVPFSRKEQPRIFHVLEETAPLVILSNSITEFAKRANFSSIISARMWLRNNNITPHFFNQKAVNRNREIYTSKRILADQREKKLVELHNQGISLRDASNQLGVSYNECRRLMNRAGITPIKKPRGDFEKAKKKYELLAKLDTSQMTLKEIAAKVDLSSNSVGRFLKRRKLEYHSKMLAYDTELQNLNTEEMSTKEIAIALGITNHQVYSILHRRNIKWKKGGHHGNENVEQKTEDLGV